mmetsp:Transcript_15326/g.22507  ORF Transcript_15326/g.22507 Transcript_15326/m.22507 type:complete len:131 (+) Transcript_15326:128-520(+)|eukprot:CAMPEP_0184742512 /NCGR_PEP_ID=MMETSP0315-20130426/5446_1 /TAXON_ID=101924 /ORGANISM="Rhodosorus marinus, Strain UTEX LB 2760" /LENGTH=130 /DNA_ID=CAMNT_0027213347 /DNA_START=82 /DNA_END=474 /DNA_ORIENTATION=+
MYRVESAIEFPLLQTTKPPAIHSSKLNVAEMAMFVREGATAPTNMLEYSFAIEVTKYSGKMLSEESTHVPSYRSLEISSDGFNGFLVAFQRIDVHHRIVSVRVRVHFELDETVHHIEGGFSFFEKRTTGQ